MDKPPYLSVVSNDSQPNDDEFISLPFYPWDERPPTVPLDQDEAATAIHLAHGDIPAAAQLLKVPAIRLHRLLRQSPRLQRILEESFALTLYRAVAIPIRTLHDPNADNRRLEWAATLLLKSRLAQGHPLSPAPAANLISAAGPSGKVIISWLDEPLPEPDVSSLSSGDHTSE